MKEFVEKLIGRLEEERKKCFILESKADTELNEQYFSGKRNAFAETIDFTNQLAEECNNDFCEWSKQGGYNFYLHKTSCGTEDTFDDSYVFCPYCGKKIKIIK